ncbi:MAG TPA: L,D-transpeptidase family protein [Rhizomicrobium sp.]|nr:L,D-transpeptidase family protein [Rhizomicrobium sp.]
MFRRWIVAWFAVGFVLSPASIRAAGDDPHNTVASASPGASPGASPSAIPAYLAQSPPGLNGADLNAVQAFYAMRGNLPAWTGSPDAESDAQLMLAALTQAGAEGLNPSDYRIAEPAGYYSGAGGMSDAQKDVAITVAAMHYANDLRDGRPWLRTIDSDVELPAKFFDAPRELATALSQRKLAAFLADLPPPNPEYAKLKALLARYAGAAAIGQPTTRRGKRALLRKLSVEDDAASSDDDVSDAVERFQKRHGLDPTGKMDPQTVAALNIAPSQRMLEIEANMERWRWLPRGLEARYIMVNVPAAKLVLVANGDTVLTSHVIVGKPEAPTPMLRADATGVTVNPPWMVPPKIARHEIIPKLAANPGYLSAHHMVWRRGGGIEQLPGGKNALGKIKLELPNRFDVYLHDTPSKRLFARDDRDLSHGCVRVQEILPLAAYALTGDTTSVSLLTSAVARGRTEHFPLSEPLPVYILYWTVFVNSDGGVEFSPDIYERDQRLIAALAAGTRNQSVTSSLN